MSWNLRTKVTFSDSVPKKLSKSYSQPPRLSTKIIFALFRTMLLFFCRNFQSFKMRFFLFLGIFQTYFTDFSSSLCSSNFFLLIFMSFFLIFSSNFHNIVKYLSFCLWKYPLSVKKKKAFRTQTHNSVYKKPF